MTISTSCNGCPHSDRPVKEVCMMCGKGVCFGCYFTDSIDTRVIEQVGFRTTNGGGRGYKATIKHGTFCAKCYLQIIQDPNYRLIKGFSDSGSPNFMKPKKPNLFGGNGMPFWWTCMVYLMMPLFCMSCFLLLDNFIKAKDAYNEFISKEEKAHSIVQAMGGI